MTGLLCIGCNPKDRFDLLVRDLLASFQSQLAWFILARHFFEEGGKIDWTKQNEELIRFWMENQQTMWNSWFGTTTDGEKGGSPNVWKQMITFWENSLKIMLKAQVDLNQAWIDNLASMDGVSAQTVESAKRHQEVAERYLTAQQELWQSLFDTMKTYQPGGVMSGLDTQTRDLVQTWQKTCEQALKAQEAWSQLWKDEGKPSGTARKKSGRKPASKS